mmetsp:Transcript_13083/g.11563  ORF Transcript_13083/g.11563 Transcript_13083/m.11563 type:complete len:83 (-) Transcript_13083:29-277(-)
MSYFKQLDLQDYKDQLKKNYKKQLKNINKNPEDDQGDPKTKKKNLKSNQIYVVNRKKLDEFNSKTYEQLQKRINKGQEDNNN